MVWRPRPISYTATLHHRHTGLEGCGRHKQLKHSCHNNVGDLLWIDLIRSKQCSHFTSNLQVCVCECEYVCMCIHPGGVHVLLSQVRSSTSSLPAEPCPRPVCLNPSFFLSILGLSLFFPLLYPVFLSHSLTARPSSLIMSSSSVIWRCGQKQRRIELLKAISHNSRVFFCVTLFRSVMAHQLSASRSSSCSC